MKEKKKERKKITMGKVDFPGVELTLLAVRHIVVVRCN
jgi:hypothetical protein